MPLGRYNRDVIPRCVVNKIWQTFREYDESQYTGFIDIQNEKNDSEATKDI